MSAARKTSGLGRGLDALLGDNAAPPEGARQAGQRQQTLPIEFLRPHPEQPRRAFNDDAIEELAASIKARGMLQPILVRPKGRDDYEIVAGERRWRAAQKARLHEVPVIIRELTDEETAEIALIENVQRVDLNPVEEAMAYQRLVDAYKRTQDEIARAVGKSRSHVANMIRLLALPPKTMEALKTGAITMGHARALLGSRRPDVVLEAVLEKQLSVRDTENVVREMLNIEKARAEGAAPAGRAAAPESKAAPARPQPKDADTRALESDLAAALGLEVAIEHTRKGSGAVTIRYLSLDQLDDICKRLMGAGV